MSPVRKQAAAPLLLTQTKQHETRGGEKLGLYNPGRTVLKSTQQENEMLTQEDLQAIRAIMREETDPIKSRLDNIETRLEKVEENTEITREATNYMADWLENVTSKVEKLTR